MKVEPIMVKSPYAKQAYEKVIKATKREVIGFNKIIPPASKELSEKKVYMQTEEFWNDPHNKKMSAYFAELMDLRDKIAEDIASHNKESGSNSRIQGTNGYTRIKKYLDQNPKMNYSETPTYNSGYDSQYYILRHFRIGNLARECLNKMKK